MNFILLVFYTVLLILILDFVRKNRKFNSIFKKEVNGCWSLPIIGGAYLIGDKPNRSFLKLSEKYGGIFKIWLGEILTMVVTDPVLINEIWVKQNDNFINRPHNTTLGLFSLNYCALNFGDYQNWKSIRAIVSSQFTKTKLNSSTVTSLIDKHLKIFIDQEMGKHCESGENFNQLIYVSKLSMNIILDMLLSVEIPSDGDGDNEEFSKLLNSIEYTFIKIGCNSPEDTFPFLLPFYKKDIDQLKFHLNVIRSYIRKIYLKQLETYDNDIGKHGNRNILDGLITDFNGELDTDTMVQVIFDVYVASTDTIANALQWFILLMINNPDIQSKLYNEIISVVGKHCKYLDNKDASKIPYLHACYSEVLRYRPPTPLSLPRIASNDTYIKDGNGNELLIPKGTTIIQNIFGLSHSEEYISDPNLFSPERWIEYKKQKELNTFLNVTNNNNGNTNKFYNDLNKISIPFGVGKRMCAAPNMAEQIILITMGNIILNYKLSACDNVTLPLSEIEIFSITIKPQPYKTKLEKRLR